jgi:hypothetical protein|tara:strand:- start:209 stop:952 length:744 start_codon:yes stop_codon:yes gene_type:complete
MAVPSTRTELKEFCLRKLGKPVIEINIDDDQMEDRIDEALAYYHDYHFDGAEKTFLKHIVTADNKTNNYIDITDGNIIGIVNIFDIGDATSTNNLFNVRYQIALNDLYDLARYDLVPYFMNMMNIRFIEEMLIGKQPLRYNRHINKLHIDMDWGKVAVGNYLIAEVYSKIDPETYNDVYSDRWLLRYTTSLFKVQWGQNLSKFVGMTLPGGIQFNGDQIMQQGVEDKRNLEQEMISSFSLPVTDMIG